VTRKVQEVLTTGVTEKAWK